MKIKHSIIPFVIMLSMQINAQTLQIAKGWQLLGTGVAVTDLSQFSTHEVYAYKNNNWEAYNVTNSSFQKLSSLNVGEGFWVNGTDSETITLSGTEDTNSSLNVKSGWQLVAATNQICSSQLFTSDSVNAVFSYENSTWKLYEPTSTTSDFSQLSTISKGSGFWINSSKETTLIPTLTITGSISDGYVKDARLEIASLETRSSVSIIADNNSSEISSDNGLFTISILNPDDSGYVISSTSGTDESTGESYEGVLKSVISTDSCSAEVKVNQNITPITTLVTETVLDTKSTNSKSRANSSIANLIAAAEERVADSIGISKAYINSDPQILLRTSENENTRAAAAKIIKTSLAIQKTAEMMASSIVDKTKTDAFNSVTNSAFKALANSISSSTNTGDFETLIADTDTLITTVVTKINEAISKKPALAQTILKPQEKLDAAKNVIQNSTDITLQIKENEIITDTTGDVQLQIEAVEKSLEIVTRKIEEKAQNIAKATTNFATEVQSVQDVIKTIAVSGGVEGTKALIQEQVKTFNADGQTIDAKDFADNLFSDNRIAQKKLEFDNLFGTDFNRNIVDAAVKSYEGIVKQQAQGLVVDQAFIKQQIKDNIAKLPTDKQAIINQNVVTNGATIITDVKKQIDVSNGFIVDSKKNIVFKPPVNTTTFAQPKDNLDSITSFTKELLIGKTFFAIYHETNDYESDIFGLWGAEELKFEDKKIVFTGLSNIDERGEDTYLLEDGKIHLFNNFDNKIIKIISSQPDFLTLEIENLKNSTKETIFMYANKNLALDAVRLKNKNLIRTPLPTFDGVKELSIDLLSGRTFYEVLFEINEPDSAFNFRWIVEKLRFTDTHMILTNLSGAKYSSVDKYSITNGIASSEEINNHNENFSKTDDFIDEPIGPSTTKLIETHSDYLILEHSENEFNKDRSRIYLSLEKAKAYAESKNKAIQEAIPIDFTDVSIFTKKIENRRLFFIFSDSNGYYLDNNFYLNSETKTTSRGEKYTIQPDGSIFIVGRDKSFTIRIKQSNSDFLEVSFDEFNKTSSFIFTDRLKAEQKLKDLNSQPIDKNPTISSGGIGTYHGTFDDLVCDTTKTQFPIEIVISDNSITFSANENGLLINGVGHIQDIDQSSATILLSTNDNVPFGVGTINKLDNTVTGNWKYTISTDQNCAGSFKASLN